MEKKEERLLVMAGEVTGHHSDSELDEWWKRGGVERKSADTTY